MECLDPLCCDIFLSCFFRSVDSVFIWKFEAETIKCGLKLFTVLSVLCVMLLLKIGVVMDVD